MRPTFLYIGPDKAGSTWMYEVLRAHPHIFVPPLKDLYFFDRYYHRGLDWYLSFFADPPSGARAAGELSHDYLYSPKAAKRIARDFPDVRLLTCLRNPVERTFSHYLFLVRSGRTSAPFELAVESFPELVRHSLYAVHLQSWLRRFGDGRIRVLWFDHLRSDPRAFANEMFEFLGVGPMEGFPYGRPVLPAARPRSRPMARLGKWGANLFRQLKMEPLLGRMKRSVVLQRLLYRRYEDEEMPRIDSSTRRELMERFHPDIERLQRLLDVDLGSWLTSHDGESAAAASKKRRTRRETRPGT